MSVLTSIHDLTHLVAPLTEDSVLRCLQARFYSRLYQTKIGPQLLCVNPFHQRPSPRPLSDPSPPSPDIRALIQELLSQHADSGQSQILLLCGESGSGKTHYARQLLGELWCRAGGGQATDAYGHLASSLTVLASLTSATTLLNDASTRVGMCVENLTSDCVIYRARIHCLFIDQRRVSHVPRGEKNYHIFYQMLAGLSSEDRVKLHLSSYSVHNLRYLSGGSQKFQNDLDESTHFQAWREGLGALGIPVNEVLRVLAAVLLLGNVQFEEGTSDLELEVIGNTEMKAVAALLGISGISLYHGFTTKTRNTRGQLCRAMTDAATANATRDALARALYHRTVSAILRRINSTRRQNSNLTHSTDSLESRGSSQYNSRPDILSQNPASPTFTLTQHGRRFSEGVITVLDLFGYEAAEVNRLEQLCVNLCAEAVHHYYSTHLFRGPLDALKEEGIETGMHIAHTDSTPIIELISAQDTGILSILDSESAQPNGSAESFVQKVKSHHRINNYFFEPLPKVDVLFGIRHYAGKVVYDASSFPSSNHDLIPDDIVCVFSKQNCNFGFAVHLFANEVKTSTEGNQGPKGLKHRVHSPYQHEGNSTNGRRASLCRDFQNRLEAMLKNISHARPHFIHCVKSNDQREPDAMERESMLRQLRSQQVLETVQIMGGGLPHRMRYKAFNSRYRMFLRDRPSHHPDSMTEECQMILSSFLKAIDEGKLPYISTQWRMGKKHIFYSEGTRQYLELMRGERLHHAAAVIQACWRGSRARQAWSPNLPLPPPLPPPHTSNSDSHPAPPTPRPARPPRTDLIKRVEPQVLNHICKIYSVDTANPPAVPPSRGYTVEGRVRLSYPQTRVMKERFPRDLPDEESFLEGEEVRVVGVSPRRGHLIVQQRGVTHHVPYSLLDLRSIPEPPGMDI